MSSLRSFGLFFFLSLSIFLGALPNSSAAANDFAARFLKDHLAKTVEVDRTKYCDICTYVCPRLFDRYKRRGIEGLQTYENRDRTREYLAPLMKPLLDHTSDSITDEECQEICGPRFKGVLITKLNIRRERLIEASIQNTDVQTYTPLEINIATGLLLDEMEADPNMIYGCRDDVRGRPDVGRMREEWPERQTYMLYYFKNRFNWE